MQIIEVDLKVPYSKRGETLKKIIGKVKGKVRDIHLFPPTYSGISEIKMEVEAENSKKFIRELRNIVREGKISFKVLSGV